MKPFKAGTKRHIYDNRIPNNEGVCLAHILAVIPHPDYPEISSIIVYRFWNKYEHQYFYGAKPLGNFAVWDSYVKKVLSDRRQKNAKKKDKKHNNNS